MAVKVVTETVSINFHRLVKDQTALDVLTQEKFELIAQTLSEIIDELVNDSAVVVEIVKQD